MKYFLSFGKLNKTFGSIILELFNSNISILYGLFSSKEIFLQLQIYNFFKSYNLIVKVFLNIKSFNYNSSNDFKLFIFSKESVMISLCFVNLASTLKFLIFFRISSLQLK